MLVLRGQYFIVRTSYFIVLLSEIISMVHGKCKFVHHLFLEIIILSAINFTSLFSP